MRLNLVNQYSSVWLVNELGIRVAYELKRQRSAEIIELSLDIYVWFIVNC